MQDKPSAQDIKELRKRVKMTLQQMADYLGVSQRTVYRWERAESRPSQLAIRQLHRLDRKLNEQA